ncbi:topoisomerase DNA-binding C4 zinc finger domain-containing protein [Brachyspira intermedia]|uniref:topoisomerase DNA-binding C4 zinc finger domain-containing protein n=1 Tax=Brachyspira intermedia TaxID=84377 RepID=UPI003005BB40
MSNSEHIKNINNTKQEISNGICPRCKGKLILREGKYGQFYGCSNYPNCKFTIKK